MKKYIAFIIALVTIACFGLPAFSGASTIGEHMAKLEADKKKKEKQLENLKQLENILENEIGKIKARIAHSAMNTAPKIGRTKANAQGFVTATGGITHSPNQRWTLDADKLRKEYENAGIYTSEEIDTIVTFHESYNQNQGFTAECTEILSQWAEAEAQLRTIKKYIERKEQEIQEVENAIRGPSASGTGAGAGGGSGGSGGGGGGGGGGGY